MSDSTSVPSNPFTLKDWERNYAIEAGLKVNDALATEDAESLAAQTYGNVIAVRAGEEESPKTKALIEALTSDEVKSFMESTYEGAVVPVF